MRLDNGLYGRTPNEHEGLSTIQDYSANMAKSEEDFKSKTDLLKAEKAKKFFIAMGTPTVEGLKSIIQMNLIKDNKITLEHVNLAEKRYGPDIGLLKGKTTRSKILSKETNWINIPKELIDKNHYTDVSMDIMSVNDIMFITAISHNLQYRTAQYIKDKSKMTISKSIKDLVNFYIRGDFIINTIHADSEFKSSIDDIKTELQIRGQFSWYHVHNSNITQCTILYSTIYKRQIKNDNFKEYILVNF